MTFSAEIELYGIGYGQLSVGSSVPSTHNRIYQYNAGTDAWDDVTADISLIPGFTDLDYEDVDGEIGRQAEGPLRMGPYSLVPGWAGIGGMGITGEEGWSAVGWARDADEIQRAIHATNWVGGSVGFFPSFFSVAPDIDNPGQYFISGGFDMIAHWDGSSLAYTNWDGGLTAAWNWGFLRGVNITGHISGDVVSQPVGAPTSWAVYFYNSTYLFYLGGYYWMMPMENSSYVSGHIISGEFTVGAQCQMLTRLQDPGSVPDTTANLGTGSLARVFLPMLDLTNFDEPASGTDSWFSPEYVGLAPIPWKRHVWLHFRRWSLVQKFHNDAWVADHTVTDIYGAYLLSDDGVIHNAGFDFSPGSGENSLCLGVYYHPERDTMYGFFSTGIPGYSGTTFIDRQVNPVMHVMELTAYDLSTYSFTWTEIGTIPTHPYHPDWDQTEQILDAVTITSNEDNLFVMWTSVDYEPDDSGSKPIFRFSLLDFSSTIWPFHGDADAPRNMAIMRFHAKPDLRMFGSVVG